MVSYVNGGKVQESICYIFSDDVNQIDYFDNPSKNKLVCKIAKINTELRNIRQYLLSKYNVEVSRMDLLDHNKILILSQNFEKITIPTVELVEDVEVVENLKKDLLVIGMGVLANLSYEIPKIKEKGHAKFRKKTRQLDKLKNFLSKNFGKIL